MRGLVRSISVLLVLGTLAGGSLNYGQLEASPPEAGKQVARAFLHPRDTTQKFGYYLYLPKDYVAGTEKSWPLLLFLHGMGERGEQLSLIKRHGPPALVERDPKYPFIVVSPQCPDGQMWNSDTLSWLLDEIESDFAVDNKRIYVTGLSMGGFGTWSLGASTPKRFAAIAPICGGGRPEWADQLKQVPIWAFHGDQDTAVLLSESQRMVDAIQAAGGNAKLTIYPGVGHDSWTQTYADPKFYEWLLRHERKE